MIRNTTQIATLIAAMSIPAALAAPAAAQMGGGQQGGQQYDRTQQRQQQRPDYTVRQRQSQQWNQQFGQQQMRQQTLTGTFEDHRQITLQGQGEPHNFVKVRLQNGRTAIVDLGPQHTPSDLNIQQGDRIAVRGQQTTVNGRPVLMATAVQAGGQQVTIQQTGRDVQRQAQGQTQGRMQGQMQNQMQGQTGQRVYGAMGMGQTLDENTARQIIQNWPQVSQKAATSMLEKYGSPDEATPSMLVWNNNGPWKRTIVYNEPVQHNFPIPHEDVLEQFINYSVPEDRFDELATFDGSVIAERTKGEISARCDQEGANILAINLAHQIAEGNLSPDKARQQYAQAIQAHMQGNTPETMQSLQFDVPRQNVNNPDERVIQRTGGQGSGNQNSGNQRSGGE